MNGNLSLNIGTLAALLIALIGGAFIGSDIYRIVQKVEQQSKATGDAVNQTISNLLTLQQDNNQRGNNTIILFQALIETIKDSSNQTLSNQELYFKPYLNQSFEKIHRALNITD